MSYAIELGTKGILESATDLPPSADFLGDDGLPDLAKIKSAAEALASDRPYLARPHGRVGAGERGTAEEAFDLHSLLRNAAG